MQIVNIQYKVFWQFKDATNYKVTKCKKIINTKKGTVLNQCVRGGSVGYWINKNFIKRNDINNYLETIKTIQLPF